MRNPRGIVFGGLRPLFVHWRRICFDPNYRNLQFQCLKLKRVPRYTPFETQLFGKTWRGPDAASFLSAFEEIFVNRIYEFEPGDRSNLIFDCGANIGLSTLFFLKEFPRAQIRSFEADPLIFSYLKDNIEQWAVPLGQRVVLENRAVFTHNNGVSFSSDGADAGHISTEHQLDRPKTASIRLKDILSVPIGFLKLDVEGAEYEILTDCATELRNVSSCFVELHSKPSEVSRLGQAIGILEAAGFRIQIHVEHSQRNPYRIHDLNEGMDLQLNVFGFR